MKEIIKSKKILIIISLVILLIGVIVLLSEKNKEDDMIQSLGITAAEGESGNRNRPHFHRRSMYSHYR